jgi:uncharacterized protein involved in exopolysaccharide biosynthesis/Mrp family chromosome partitioning ATPase
MEIRDPFPPGPATFIDQPLPAAPAPRVDERALAPEEPHLMQLARILRRRRRLIVTIAACGTMLAGVASLLVPPKYTATAQLVVEPQQTAPIGNRVDGSRPTDQSVIDTHVTMLSSRDHLRHVLDSLSGNSAFAVPGQATAETNATGMPNDYPPRSAAANGAVEPTETMNSAPGFDELVRRAKIWLGAIVGREPAPTRELDALDQGLKVLQERTSRVISVSFTAKSPDKAAAIVNRVVQLYVSGQVEQKRAQANQELAALDERAGKLKTELESASEITQTLLLPQPGAAPGASGKGGEQDARLRALERDAAASGQAYAGLLQRQKDIRDQQETVTPDIRVLSLASPPDRPSSVNPILFIFPALIASLMSASLLAIVLEQLDQGLRNERDVTDALGLPCIGLVPRLPPSYANQPFRYLLSKPLTPYAEAIRSAAATLRLADPHQRPTTILISSSVPGEGKTTIAASLCVYASLLGRRVLLVDFDWRHPSALRALGGRPAEPPLPDIKDLRPQELIQHIADLNLDYLAMPRDSADPLAPFVGKRMQRLLRQIAGNYDCVFIDSAPLLGVTETRLLASLVDRVVFVIKWGSTRREVVQNAGNVLRGALRPDGGGVVSVSALVTQVDLKRHADYRYGDVGEAFSKYRKYYFGSA